MVRAYHCIFCAYGFWLPNDPRGSWSDYVRAWELALHGPATKTSARRSVATRPHGRRARRAAKDALRYPPVRFNGRQARTVAQGFADISAIAGYVVYACSILPEHVHIVIHRHHYVIEQVVARLKGKATERLRLDDCHPMRAHTSADQPLPSPWARNGWNVYLNSGAEIRRACDYVRDNPMREGKRRQHWRFVTEY